MLSISTSLPIWLDHEDVSIVAGKWRRVNANGHESMKKMIFKVFFPVFTLCVCV
jgi:hypothetical protein